MSQQQRNADLYGRQEPTMSVGQVVRPPVPVNVDRPQPAKTALRPPQTQTRQRESASGILKLGLWLTAWFVMLCVCQKVAEASGFHDVQSLQIALEVLGTLVLLAIRFWRVLWGVMWWLIGLLILLAIVKGAFLIVFRL